MTPKLTVEEFKEIHEGEWFEFIDFEQAKKQHKKNIEACFAAVREYSKKDRPLRVLAVHGSGRSGTDSCAYEASNSKMFLQTCMEIIPDLDPDIEIDQVSLREYDIEPCNGCVSTCSPLCGFPCDCFPFDPMQQLYPKVLRADILFCSTGVNQSTMSTRLKAFCDRLVSLDGGFFRDMEQFAPKDGEFKDRMLALSASQAISYDQRLYGRVGAYFISSKDEHNHHKTVNHLKTDFDKFHFIEMTSHVLRDGFEAYGYFHSPNFYAGAPADPDVDYMYDKEYMQNHPEIFEKGRRVVKDAIDLSKELKTNLPKFYPDRFNRT